MRETGGNSDQITRAYFDTLLVEMRLIDSRKADTTFTLYGEKFGTPIMTAAMSHLDGICKHGMAELARGAALSNAVNWVGMGTEEELSEIQETGARTIRIIKPYADKNLIFQQLEQAQRCGALAVGMDVDCVFDDKGEYRVIDKERMQPQSMEEIGEYVQASKLPFIVKGIQGTRDAYKCLCAGAKGIVVSHHHGIMDYALPPLMALPEILKVTEKQIPVFVDCGILSGMDAFKALALGAAGVCVGRALLKSLEESGAGGVATTISQMNDELKGVMAKTGCYDLAHMDMEVIHRL